MELLIAIGVIALLLAILMPALSASRHAAKDVECRAKYRTVVQKFIEFADESGAGLRGDSQNLGADRFLLEDFQESLYQVHEFWQGPKSESESIKASESPLVCPEKATRLTRRSGVPCSAGAVGPQKEVSSGFNKRLDRKTRFIKGKPFPTTAFLSSRILTNPDVPLVFDVDGAVAVERRLAPYYSAPPMKYDDQKDIYESGVSWFPAMRHMGRMNVGFIGGHVLSTDDPVSEPWSRWEFQLD